MSEVVVITPLNLSLGVLTRSGDVIHPQLRPLGLGPRLSKPGEKGWIFGEVPLGFP